MAVSLAGDAASAAGPAAADYAQEIKPLLEKRCAACHGALQQKSGLRLDTAAAAKKGGDSGPAIVPGQPGESLLIGVVTGEAGFRMPPEGDPLSDAEIVKLKTWIALGAPAPDGERPLDDPRSHWSYQPVARPDVPDERLRGWPANELDAFIAAGLEQRELAPRPAADRGILLRRVYLDLIGLPPTRDELHEFLTDRSDDAWQRVVDRLLASPHYGERWGRHWMDVWRYSDWYGRRSQNEIRYGQYHLWRWRDWIIESLNA
ncbi:MAG TPA: DUF1549 domain-containing protein, partial [Planctomycetaceae bacterium]|nr:DUF1549 domain-containing protein [Planctomycetaceae bacterium]